MDIILVTAPVPLETAAAMARAGFGDMVKAVVDLKKGIMALGGELHADAEALLLEQGSAQDDLWGINLYPEARKDEFIVFDSMINIRPRQGNRSRNVESPEIRDKIAALIGKLVTR